MPPYRPPSTPLRAWLILAALLLTCTFATAGLYLLIFTVVGLVLAPVLLIADRAARADRATRRAARQRDICSIARSFDCRQTDTWIIRATFDALSIRRDSPVLAQSHLEQDLDLDADDLEQISLNVAQRTGRQINSASSPPFTGTTLAELIMWFNALPKHPRSAP